MVARRRTQLPQQSDSPYGLDPGDLALGPACQPRVLVRHIRQMAIQSAGEGEAGSPHSPRFSQSPQGRARRAAHECPAQRSNHPPTALGATREWERMTVGGREPRYSDNFRKRLDLPTGAVPATPPVVGNGVKEYGVASYLSPTDGTSPYGDYMGGAPLSSTPSLTTSEGHDDKSLTDLKWGKFEALGFDEQGAQDKLKFDLRESARSARKVKRGTISWNDFSSDGFLRGDDGLDEGLRFTLDNPLGVGASAHPLSDKEIKERHAELTKKLKKRGKSLPAFGWDTAPVLGPDVLIEEVLPRRVLRLAVRRVADTV
ncbi:hypothetical protein EV715DRAFT_268242 [Schizophyllum commune]